MRTAKTDSPLFKPCSADRLGRLGAERLEGIVMDWMTGQFQINVLQPNRLDSDGLHWDAMEELKNLLQCVGFR